MVHVDLSDSRRREASALQLLDNLERSRAARFRSQRGRTNFLLCRAALRINLCERLGCTNSQLHISYERNERPEAFVNEARIPLEFNVSHTNGHGLLAFTKIGRIGVDIEQRIVRHDVDGEIRHVFSHEEQIMLKNASPSTKITLFLRLWTLKEAVIKATGEGFRADTTAFTIPKTMAFGAKHAVMRFGDNPTVDWKLVNLESERFVAAFAHEVVSEH